VDKTGPNLYVVEPSGVFFVSHRPVYFPLDRQLTYHRDTMVLLWARVDNSPRLNWRN
jgi:hypothetical protein